MHRITALSLVLMLGSGFAAQAWEQTWWPDDRWDFDICDTLKSGPQICQD